DGEIVVDALSNAVERPREFRESRVLRALAPFAPFGMIDVLLAALLVAAGGLDVAFRVRAQPNIAPSRRHGERREAPSDGRVAYAPAVLVQVDEAAAAPPARQARLVAVDVAQAAAVRRASLTVAGPTRPA